MRILLLALFFCFMLPGVSQAKDRYYKSGVTWQTSFTIGDNVTVRSAFQLDSREVQIINTVYKRTRKKFFRSWGIKPTQCRLGHLNVRIVRDHFDLDNREFFPEEPVYADLPWEGTEIIFGRYYRKANTIYIVPLKLKKYYWRKNFAHELLHYFFDECGVRFSNIDEEHIIIDDFLFKYRKYFY